MREVKKPLHAEPMKQQPLHKDVRYFAETGRLVAGSQAYQQAFVALRHTALGRRLDISDNATRSRLFVSQDFRYVHFEVKFFLFGSKFRSHILFLLYFSE